MATTFETQKAFTTATKARDKKITGADMVMIISGYENLSFNIKTHSLPMIKNDESIETVGLHGVKTQEDGYPQTFNELQVTFNENQSFLAKETIESIIIEGKNDELEINFYGGRDMDAMRHWGKLSYAHIGISDNPEGDVEGTSTAMSISATVKGHYEVPENKGDTVSIKTKLGL